MTLRSDIQQIVREAYDDGANALDPNDKKLTDAILSKFLERLPKEKRYLQGLTNSSALEEAGYDQAIRDVKEIIK